MKRLFVTGLLFMFMVVAPVVSSFAAGPVAVTNSGPISSVTVAGLVAQNGTPTPTTPIDIVSNNGVIKYGQYGKNLFDKTLEFKRGYISTNGTIGGGSTSALMWNTYPIEVKPNTTYTLINPDYESSGTKNISLTSQANINYLQDQSSFVERAWSGSDMSVATFTTTAETHGVIITLSWGQDLSRVMLVEGFEVPTEYEPYHFGIHTDGVVETIGDSANHTATVATLLGVGDYRDTQNINTGAITRNVVVKVLDGTEDWATSSAQNVYRLPGIQEALMSNTCICSHYLGVSSTTLAANMPDLSVRCGYVGYEDSLYIKDSTVGNLTQFKQWLADQYAAGTPVMIVYPLATPTTESVAGQTMTTAPVNNRTGGVTGMTITTLLSSGASVVTTIAANAIKIATTAYNAARFSPVVTDLNSTIATIREIVTKTINQTAAIASLQADKQTRPEDACPAGKKCLLVETEENGVIVPHWFPIIEAPENTE